MSPYLTLHSSYQMFILNVVHVQTGTANRWPVNFARLGSSADFKLFSGDVEVTPSGTTLVASNFAAVSIADGTLTLSPRDAIALADIDYETVDKIQMVVNLKQERGTRQYPIIDIATITLEYRITDVEHEIYLTSAAEPKTIDYLTDEHDGVFLSLTEMDLNLDGLTNNDGVVITASELVEYTVEEVREDGTLLTGPNVFTYDDDASGLVVVNGPWTTLRAERLDRGNNRLNVFRGIVGKTYTVRLSATHPTLPTGVSSLMVDVVVNCDANHIIDGTPTIAVGDRSYEILERGGSPSDLNILTNINQTNVLYVRETPENVALPDISFELSEFILNVARAYGTPRAIYRPTGARFISADFKLFKTVDGVEGEVTPAADTTLVANNFANVGLANVGLANGTLTLTPNNTAAGIDLADIDYETIDKIQMVVGLRFSRLTTDSRSHRRVDIIEITLEYHITDDPEIYLTSAADPKTIDYLTVSEDGVFLSLD